MLGNNARNKNFSPNQRRKKNSQKQISQINSLKMSNMPGTFQGGGMHRNIRCETCDKGITGSVKEVVSWANRHAKYCVVFAEAYNRNDNKNVLSRPLVYYKKVKISHQDKKIGAGWYDTDDRAMAKGMAFNAFINDLDEIMNDNNDFQFENMDAKDLYEMITND